MFLLYGKISDDLHSVEIPQMYRDFTCQKVKIDPLLLFKEERTRIPKTFWLDMDFNNDEIFIY